MEALKGIALRVTSYHLKCRVDEQVSGFRISGRKRGERRVRITSTYLQWRDDLGIDDYRRK